MIRVLHVSLVLYVGPMNEFCVNMSSFLRAVFTHRAC